MKKFLALALALVMMMAVCLPVYAAVSPQKPVDGVIDKVTDKDGNDITGELKLEINDESKKAEEELSNDKIKEILGGDYKDTLVLGDVYDVIYEGGFPVSVTVKKSVAKDDTVFVLTKVDGKWVKVDGVVVADGRITFTLTEASVVALVYDRITEGTGPETGNNVVFVAMIALVCLAGTVYSVKRTVA